ncbi:MAG: coenzyme A pyrophosphatase [Paracoccaceae bacterium]|nr:MAG: coenzyme A pyrophosphatase [Paracoccaceae bacterium]
MPVPCTRSCLERAVRGPSVGGSSDFELNPEVGAALPPGRRLRPAAVLVPVRERPEGMSLILTRRAEGLRHHGGQVAFPGGKVEPHDPSPLHAALREAEEEIGLPPDRVEVLGPIDGHETVTGFLITPYVGLVPADFRPLPDPSEVAAVFEVPLDFLMDPANHRKGFRDWQGRRRWFYEMPWGDHYIWGATARILKGLSLRLAALEHA